MGFILMSALLLILACFLVSSLWRVISSLQFFQLEEYSSGRFIRWSLKNWQRVVWPNELVVVAAAVAVSDPRGQKSR